MYIFQPDRFLLQEQVKKYSSYIKGRVLDIGAGEYTRYRNFFDCEEYIKMDVGKSENVDVIGSIENIPLIDASVDSVVCTQVFEHLKHPQKSAEEVFRVLKKGGYLLVTVPQVNELHEEPNDFFRYTNYGLKVLFEEAGFEIVKSDQRGGFFAVVAQIKIRYMIDRINLYKRPFVGYAISKLLSIYGRIMLWLDKIDVSVANRKHAIGWCFIFKK